MWNRKLKDLGPLTEGFPIREFLTKEISEHTISTLIKMCHVTLLMKVELETT